jgi:hypothetical protein
MPLWDVEELEVIAPLFPKSNKWRHRFEILGGIPRHVLEVTKRSPTDILIQACLSSSLDDCLTMIDLDSTVAEESKSIHFLVHMTSTPPFMDPEPSVQFASPAALEIIVRQKGDEARQRMRNQLTDCEWNPLAAGVFACVFKRHALELLEKGGTFTFRALIGGRKRKKVEDTTLLIPSSILEVVDRIPRKQARNELYVSERVYSTAFDAWIPGIGAFQSTIGKECPTNDGARDELAFLHHVKKLYWMLPPPHYEHFRIQSPQAIEQYALLVPFPEL